MDTVGNACDICPGFDDNDVDSDRDGVPDGCDNCPPKANPGQQDADADGYGDRCDGPGDINHDGSVTLVDFAAFCLCFGRSEPGPGCDANKFAECDLTGDGVVDLNDFTIFAIVFGQTYEVAQHSGAGQPDPLHDDTSKG